jgi:hypothetical protein
MSTELIERPLEITTDVQLVATNADQMRVCQQQLVEWFGAKLTTAREEFRDASDAQLACQNAGMKTAALTNMLRKAEKRIIYYEKCAEAVKAGYTLVPTFPVEIFAVRTKRRRPDVMQPRSEAPKVGEGEYFDDRAVGHWRPGKLENERSRWVPDEFNDVIDFPLQLAKAEIIDAARAAMQLKVFDELGFTADSEVTTPERRVVSGRGDPMLFGIIRHHARNAYIDRATMFLIAWYIDTRKL